MNGLTRNLVVSALVMLVGALSACHDKPGPAPAGVRLAVLSPALGIVIRDLGASDLVVARHGWDLALDESIPVGGDQSGLDYEALLRARPTHVLLEWPGDPPQRLLRLAEARGWTVLDYETLSLDDLMRAADDLHARFAPEPKGPAPSAQLREAIAPARPYEGAGRVLLIVPGAVPAALGPGSFHHEILVRLGATPAITDGGPWITLDGEDAMDIAPDSIVIVDPRPRGAPPAPAPTWDGLASRLGRMATLPIPAIEARRVALMEDAEDLTPSTAMIDWARRLRGILMEWDREGGGSR